MRDVIERLLFCLDAGTLTLNSLFTQPFLKLTGGGEWMGVPGALENWPCVDIATLVSHRSGQNFPMNEENELLLLSGLV